MKNQLTLLAQSDFYWPRQIGSVLKSQIVLDLYGVMGIAAEKQT
jgi:hypothetical protein